jgi:hypothetical protein
MSDDLPAFIQLLSSFADDGFTRTILGALTVTVLTGFAGAVVGLVLGTVVATPALRWGVGRAGVWGCLATALLVIGGILGFSWAGAWIGGGRAIAHLVEERLVVEELALRALVTSATAGDTDLDVDGLADRLSEAFESGDGVVQEILTEIDAELRSADPDGELDALVPRQAIEDALDRVREQGLADPDRLARAWRAGGLAAARDSRDPDLAAYADQLLETTAPMRAEIVRLVDAVVWPSALPGALAGVLTPLFLVLVVAALGRWWRRPEPA